MEKVCPHCNKWTPWQNSIADKCIHCGELLQPERKKEIEDVKARQLDYKRSDWFIIKPTDGILMRITRKVGLFFHVVFGAIAWFFIWTFVNAAA